MSYQFGAKSLAKLDTCCPDLQAIAHRALELTPMDFTIVHGWRNQEQQDLLFDSGASKVKWPDSKHNHTSEGQPDSLAIDFAPWINGTIPWKDTHAFAVLAGVFFAAAAEMDITLRWGGDWDMDGLTTDQTFMDWGHIEVSE